MPISTETDNWFTPPEIVDKVRNVLGKIDLDPASTVIANNMRIGARYIYTIENSGLIPENKWFGKVFINPPYSSPLLSQFIQRTVKEYEEGNISEFIILTNSGTDTQWNQPLTDYTQLYTLGRISFIRPDGTVAKGSTSRGQVFTYGGDNIDLFIEEFTKDDFCWVPNAHFRKQSAWNSVKGFFSQ